MSKPGTLHYFARSSIYPEKEVKREFQGRKIGNY
jgi:hypothetical protein